MEVRMRRSSKRQKRNGDQQDWCNRWARRAYGLTRRPGSGKYAKRTLARKHRRELRRQMIAGDRDDDADADIQYPP